MSEDLDLRAAEYVLGTLDHDERVAFSTLLRSDAGANHAVGAWEARFAGLAGRIDPVAPSIDVWHRIERALDRPKSQPFTLIQGGASRGDGASIARSPNLAASRDRWRLAALVSGSIAAALLLFVGERSLIGAGSEPSDVSYVAAVNRDGAKPALLIRVDMKTRRVFVRPVATETPAGRSLELWYIGDNKPPRSMGLVDRTQSVLPIPRGAQATDAVFAVSVEPQGGSKTGGPTGAVVYSGELLKE